MSKTPEEIREYNRLAKRRSRAKRKLAAAHGDSKAREAILKEREYQSKYQKDYQPVYRKKHTDENSSFRSAKSYINKKANKEELQILSNLIKKRLN